ncbi:MAG: response regulator [Fibrobacter sp.]|uniref:response regulator n=1 Tax=Fibrobacter sp. TaxID=35828 RepID=UPI0025BC94D8|nr:response regulator [Fibrobacter sp.]MBS7272139.1 response regulator [Fibrobacter sp.]
MLFQKIEKEQTLWLRYGIVLLIVSIIVVSTVSYLVRAYTVPAKANILQSCAFLNKKDAFAVENFLNREESVLKMASRVANLLVENHAVSGQIESLKTRTREENPRFGDLYGFINGKPYGKYPLADSVNPASEPWFQGALLAHGDIARIPIHKGKESMVVLSKRLSDMKSVIALNVNLSALRNFVNPWTLPSIWMIMDEQGLIIAHSIEANQGLNYSSSEFWNNDERKLADQVTSSSNEAPGEKQFLLNYDGVDYQVFSTPIKGSWFMVRMVENKVLWNEMYWTVFKGIAVVVLLYVLMILLMSLSLMNRFRAIRVSQAKSGFLANMSREIRTSITGLLGMNSIVMKEVRDDGLKEYLKNIQNTGQGILSLVNDVLDVCRIESGKMSIVSMEYDIFSVLADCYSANEQKASAKKLRFTVDCNPDIPSSLWGDENRIRQIINNLLSNAIKFTEVGEVTLLVNYENLPPVGTLKSDEYVMLSFTVKDTGTGIKKDELGLIFNKFASQNMDDLSEGIGLGLCLTKELVEKCGGQITVNSRLGEGSSFTVRIPQLVLNIEPMGDFALRYRGLGRKRGDFSGIFLAPEARILIVDDVELNLKVLRGFLRRFKVQVDVAVSGAQCLKLAQSKHYDLIFLDHMMPVMDGVETYRRLKSLDNFINKDTPVIALTSEGSNEVSESFLVMGFADYLPKPIKERDLQRALKWYLPKQLVLSGEDIQEVAGVQTSVDTIQLPMPAPTFNDEIELLQVTVNPYEKLAPFKDCLDIKAGLEYCADDSDIYIEMLQEFIASPLHRNVETCFRNEDWENYIFYMHVLSGSSSAIGAISMTEKFQNLENACRESRMNIVRENHDLVMALHAELVRNIQKGLEG